MIMIRLLWSGSEFANMTYSSRNSYCCYFILSVAGLFTPRSSFGAFI